MGGDCHDHPLVVVSGSNGAVAFLKEGRKRLEDETGLVCVEQPDALAIADTVIMAVPDRLIGKILESKIEERFAQVKSRLREMGRLLQALRTKEGCQTKNLQFFLHVRHYSWILENTLSRVFFTIKKHHKFSKKPSGLELSSPKEEFALSPIWRAPLRNTAWVCLFFETRSMSSSAGT